MSAQIAFEGLQNTRDLGGMATSEGKRIREGLLYRSGQLFFATEADLRKLNSLDIGLVVDFRSMPEREEKPDPAIEGAQNLHLPIIQDVRAGITRGSEGNGRMIDMVLSGHMSEDMVDQHMRRMYYEFVTEPFANGQYARFITEAVATAKQGKATLWHCTAGKDRAGFATVIMLEVLGVGRESIFADYMQTNACLTETVDELIVTLAGRLPTEVSIGPLRRFFLADESYLASAYDAIDERFGSFDSFLEQALRIDQPTRSAIQALFLE